MTRTVVHVSDGNLFGGTEQAILQLLEGLDRDRWKCVLLHQPARGISPLVEGARSLGVEHRVSETARTFRGWARVPQLVHLLRSMRPAVVHAHLNEPLACTVTLVAAGLARVPAVIATAQLHVDLSSGRSAAQHRLVASNVHRYIAVSEAVAEKLRRQLGVPGRKIRTVRNAVELGRFTRPMSRALHDELTGGTNAPVILTVARLHRRKGHRSLLQAAARLPGTVFVFAGDGPERPALEREAAALGVADRVRFLGHRTDIAELLSACDVFALPSLYEGLPLAVLEAMAAGKPVIGTSTAGIDEAVVDGETGLLVAPSDPDALADAIRQVIDDEAFARRLGVNGQARVARDFTSGAMVKRVEGIYEELLA